MKNRNKLFWGLCIITVVFAAFRVSTVLSGGKPYSEFDDAAFYSISETENLELGSVPLITVQAELTGATLKVKQGIAFPENLSGVSLCIPSQNYANTIIKSVHSQTGISAFWVADGMNLTVNFIENGSRMFLEYEIALSDKNDILTFSKNQVLLTNFLIVPSISIDNSPVLAVRSAFGDPVTYGLYDYDITLTTDQKYEHFAPGKVSQQKYSKKISTRFNAKSMRDFPIALFENPNVVSVPMGDCTVHFVNNAELAEKFVEYALSFANKNIGAYPYDELFVVRASIGKMGMEHSAMILLDHSCYASVETLKSVTYHEMAHQWFYGIIGVDQIGEPFLDEGLATFFSAYLRNADAAANNTNFVKPLTAYKTKQEYLDLAYDNASMYVASLCKKDERAFFNTLQKIYNEKKFSTLSYREFNEYFNY